MEAGSLLATDPAEMRAVVHQKTGAREFQVAFSAISPNWKLLEA